VEKNKFFRGEGELSLLIIKFEMSEKRKKKSQFSCGGKEKESGGERRGFLPVRGGKGKKRVREKEPFKMRKEKEKGSLSRRWKRGRKLKALELVGKGN